jgi:hypothetical protein
LHISQAVRVAEWRRRKALLPHEEALQRLFLTPVSCEGAFWLLAAPSLFPSFTVQDLLTVLLRVARSPTIPAVLLTFCSPKPHFSNNSQALRAWSASFGGCLLLVKTIIALIAQGTGYESCCDMMKCFTAML